MQLLQTKRLAGSCTLHARWIKKQKKSRILTEAMEASTLSTFLRWQRMAVCRVGVHWRARPLLCQSRKRGCGIAW